MEWSCGSHGKHVSLHTGSVDALIAMLQGTFLVAAVVRILLQRMARADVVENSTASNCSTTSTTFLGLCRPPSPSQRPIGQRNLPPKQSFLHNNLSVEAMADYMFGGTDEENVELKKLNAEVVSVLDLSHRPHGMLTDHLLSG